MLQRSSSSDQTATSTEPSTLVQISHQRTKRRRSFDEESFDGLPLFHHRTAAGRRDTSRSRSPATEKCIHTIPALVLLCLFTLWWFSFPVDLEIKDGTIMAIRQIHRSLPNNTQIDLTVLAVAVSSPIPANNPQNLSGEDETYLQPASSPN